MRDLFCKLTTCVWHSWMSQHEAMEKLNLQAHQSARGHTDEFVLEAFITFDKLPFLVRDVILYGLMMTYDARPVAWCRIQTMRV
jgi:hypothetical protein